MDDLISGLKGPIAVLGAKGFIGNHLVNYLKRERDDVLVATRENLWEILSKNPKTIFNLIAYGNHCNQREFNKIYTTNFILTEEIISRLKISGFNAYVHAGSSAEYGIRSYSVGEDEGLRPNTHYAVSKAACSQLIHYLGKHENLPVSHLRLYAVYGAWDEDYKLIPTIVRCGFRHKFPPKLKSKLKRDFIYVDDVCEAFVRAALKATPGDAYNIGTGIDLTLKQVAEIAKDVFDIDDEPVFIHDVDGWDCLESKAKIDKAKSVLGFSPKISFKEGLIKMATEEGRYAELVS